MRNVITLANFTQFIEACAMLVPHGVTFEAHAPSLTITLTGGY